MSRLPESGLLYCYSSGSYWSCASGSPGSPVPRCQLWRFRAARYGVKASVGDCVRSRTASQRCPRMLLARWDSACWVRVSRSSSFAPATGLVKDAARPAYWVPDHEILHCHSCRKEFSIKLSKHHCRACGQGFCDECSHDRRAVPSRGWDHPVRVCFNCNKKPGDL